MSLFDLTTTKRTAEYKVDDKSLTNFSVFERYKMFLFLYIFIYFVYIHGI